MDQHGDTPARASLVAERTAELRHTEACLEEAQRLSHTGTIDLTLFQALARRLADALTERKRAEALVEDLAGRLIAAQEEERRRIGRELHDHISQRLAVLAIFADRLRANESLPTPVLSALDDIYREA